MMPDDSTHTVSTHGASTHAGRATRAAPPVRPPVAAG